MHQIEDARERAPAELAAILAEAFRADPVMRHISPRPDYAETAFTPLLPDYQRYGHCYIDAGGNAVALCLPPGAQAAPVFGAADLWRGLRRFGMGSLLRSLRVYRMMQRYHPTVPHYYLFAIGTRDGARHTGMGSALMKRLLQTADAAGVPTYLENSSVANLPFYRKHGFEVLRELTLPDRGPPMWLMQRECRG